ncbi:MAG: helix-turn-helix domain-containing protein [Pedobacter sp.]|nr:MAG: helix-turn-helix domain-containing protein [Pedobacter sp.]
METIHMGKLLEITIRKKGINITKLATALGITRRTLYNWFKNPSIDELLLEKISSMISNDFASSEISHPIILTLPFGKRLVPEEKDQEYWRNKYIDLLERYSKLLEAKA